MMRSFVVYIIMYFALTLSTMAQAKIDIIGGMSYDWGTVKPIESPLKTRIMITNKGDEPLRIYEVKPACGCTTAPIDKDVLLPGDTATVDVTLDLKNTDGKLEKMVSFMSNDPVTPTARFKLNANVIVPLSKSPNYLPFGIADVGSEAEARMIITNNTEKDITVIRVVTTPLNLNINIDKGTVLKAGEKFEVISKMKPSKGGKFECAVTITTDNIDAPRLQMSGWGKAKVANNNE